MEKFYIELCSKMMLSGSQNLMKIWKILCDEEEAKLALLLPGQSEELAPKIGKSVKEMDKMLHTLFMKGVAFKSRRDGKTSYKLAKNLTQLHDATIVWDSATDEFFELWTKVLDDDMTALLKSLPKDFSMPTTLRIIPVAETIEPGSSVLHHEECVKLVEDAVKIAVVKCPCRLSQKNCDAPVESCLQINRGAEYALDRGHGREVTKDEAVKILAEASKAGLVHVVENREQTSFICNCCNCCCESLRVLKNAGKDWILAPSRYMAIVKKDECISCGDCVDLCPFDAITMGDIAEINEAKCLGCGVCSANCPADAITLKQTRPESHIPAK
jgi:ferredoxin